MSVFIIVRSPYLEFPSLALTDLNAMHGTVEFQKECDKAGLRAIHGVELTDDRPVDTDPVPDEPRVEAGDGGETGSWEELMPVGRRSDAWSQYEDRQAEIDEGGPMKIKEYS